VIILEAVIIGTAGHVDHGKSAMINALTGTDTDRLKEEKERGISIDLGFASFPLPDGRKAGIVDVPGHERFINNMLVGASGVDLVLLVIDVNEGMMEQTWEHLEILELLGLQKGMVVLTKIDLAGEEWCDMVEEEVREQLKGTFLEDKPLCRISAVSGEGIEELKKKLENLTEDVSPRDLHAPARLPVDRAFSIAGFGTIVTGTLLQGRIKTGDTVEILPSEVEARVRSLQVHGLNVEEARGGQRVAINLSGLQKDDVERGSVVCMPGYFELNSLMDASLELLERAPRGLKHLDPVHLYLGTTRVVARIALLEKEVLYPGESSLVQLRLDSPLVAERKDRFIIRSYSPVTTIGGGVILDPGSERRRRPRRFRDGSLKYLRELEQEVKETDSDKSFVEQKIRQLKMADISRLETSTRLGPDKLKSILAELEDEQMVMALGGSFITADNLQEWENSLLSFLEDYHRKYPLSTGMPRAQLKSAIPAELSLREYDAFLDYIYHKGEIELSGDKVCRAGFYPEPTDSEKKLLEQIISIYKNAGFQPPTLKEMSSTLGKDVNYLESLLEYMINRGMLVKIHDDMYLLVELYRQAVQVLKDHFARHETLTMAEYRDYLQSSRKYMQSLLEFFDQQKITRRKGDYRVPRKLEQEGEVHCSE